MKFKALILSAGLGTRLRPITNSIPKCLVKIGEKPLLKYWLDHLANIGCEAVLINTHHHANILKSYIATLNYENMKIHTTYEKYLLGTAKSLIFNYEFFKNGNTLFMHSDNFSKVNLEELILTHQSRVKGTILSMLTFNSNNPSSCGIVGKNSDGVMTSFYEKISNPPSNCANGAIYFFSQEFLTWLVKNKKDAVDFSIDVLPFLNGLIQTCHTNLPYIDIGTPESLSKARLLHDKLFN